MAQNFVNEPNFLAAAEALHTAGNELAKCPNLPAVSGGDAILTAIQGIERTIQDVERRLNTQMQTISTQLTLQIDLISTRQQSSDHNNYARLVNRALRDPGENLVGLRDSNNSPIAGFPATPAAIRQLRAPQLDAILQALGVENAGTVDDKRARLRLIIGMTPILV